MRRKSVWLVVSIAIALVGAFFLQTSPSERAPAAEIHVTAPAKIESKQEIAPTAAPEANVQPPKAEKPRIKFTMQERKAAALEEIPSGVKKLNELPELQAVAKKHYQPRLGPELNRQSGYVLYRSQNTTSSVQAFDGTHLPVVKYPGRAVLGVVTGEIEVVFKTYPADIARYAREKNLELAGEAQNIKTVYFSAKQFPANLAAIVEALAQLPEVRSAEIAIIYGSRRGT